MIELHTLDGGQGHELHCTGRLSGAELRAVDDWRLERPELAARTRYQLTDLTAVTELAVSREDIARIVDRGAGLRKLAKPAALVVVAPSAHHYGMGRMWESYLALHESELPWITHVARDRGAAERWIVESVGSLFGAPPALARDAGPPLAMFGGERPAAAEGVAPPTAD